MNSIKIMEANIEDLISKRKFIERKVLNHVRTNGSYHIGDFVLELNQINAISYAIQNSENMLQTFKSAETVSHIQTEG